MTAEWDADDLPDPVIRLDGRAVILAANAAACHLTGFSADQLVGRPCHEALAPRDDEGRPLLRTGWPRASSLPSVRRIPEHEVVIRGADGGDVRTFVTGSYRRDGASGVTAATLVLRHAGRRRDLAAAGAQVVSTVSHELRSPLTSVKGYTSLLLNRWDRLADDDKKMMLEQVQHDADRVTRLITELLDISRLASGRLVLRRQMVDLAELAGSVVAKVAMEYPALDAHLEFAENLPSVYADPDKIVQVMTNLVENACKYASTEGLRVAGTYDDDDVTISVTDRGEGIPAEDLPRVFNRFFRRAEGRPTGSGLGLWISRGLVEAHGGRLEVESVVGQGTTFRFALPRGAFDEAHPEPGGSR
ncbi:MAG TPA: PAS domain-containing sensor histidine kinase [Acidimicrobiales bacterium]|nr:PAS domain-containing sensor histidine kinase [Acidimicrobiales bacterium]